MFILPKKRNESNSPPAQSTLDIVVRAHGLPMREDDGRKLSKGIYCSPQTSHIESLFGVENASVQREVHWENRELHTGRRAARQDDGGGKTKGEKENEKKASLLERLGNRQELGSYRLAIKVDGDNNGDILRLWAFFNPAAPVLVRAPLPLVPLAHSSPAPFPLILSLSSLRSTFITLTLSLSLSFHATSSRVMHWSGLRPPVWLSTGR